MLYLASQSPQRQQLLNDAGIIFSLVDSTCDEEAINLPHPQACAVERAVAKARGVARDALPKEGGHVILAADTIASIDGDLIGKPVDREHAKLTLQRLQGSTHLVTTAHCLMMPDANSMSPRQAIGVAVTRITMRNMSDENIDAYLDTGEWQGRAGAYAIQETADEYVAEREGEFDTVVGLNIATVRRLYREVTDQELPA